MQTFLSEVATNLYAKYGDEVSTLSIVFPSRRARKFFAEALTDIVDRPLWEPEYLSIDDICAELTTLRKADRLRLITELYKVYSRYHNEDFSHFYFWGDLLLADFDMIDKYMVDAEQLFRNILDLKTLETDLSYLTPEQAKIVADFWRSVEPGANISLSEQKRRFLEVWNSLYAVYMEFRAALQREGIAYAGMITRSVVERIATENLVLPQKKHFVVAGFNALTECERRVLRWLGKQTQVDYYWDYDNYYTANHDQEAGRFVRQNIADFPMNDYVSHDNFRNIRSLKSISTGSNVMQCRYVAKLLREIAEEQGSIGRETAIVLTDETLLEPLLYALPKEMGRVNVTMGYPLHSTLAYSLFERLIELHTHARTDKEGRTTFYHVDVEGVLSHPYISSLTDTTAVETLRERIKKERLIRVPASEMATTPLLEALFCPIASDDGGKLLEVLRSAITLVAESECKEETYSHRLSYLAVMTEQLATLGNMVSQCGTAVTVSVARSLARRHLQSVRIPFEGEPLEGIQIMGILETRNLDFRNVIILSMTDDTFPGNHSSDPSFVPYNLRYAYGLPTPELHEAVYAYYFYRLIQRAENVRMVYCSHADEKSTGEPSRYIRQLEYESGMKVEHVNVSIDVNLPSASPFEIAKRGETAAALMRLLDGTADAPTMSPTAISTYVKCPMRFYLSYVAALRADEDLTDDVDDRIFGNIFHKAAELLYNKVKAEHHPASMLAALVKQGEVERAVDEALREEYFQLNKRNGTDQRPTPELSGEISIIRDIIIRYLRDNVVAYDMRNDNFAVVDTECRITYPFRFAVGGVEHTVHLKGFSDRIDSLDNGQLRIVDYKTGSPRLEFISLEQLFHGKTTDRLSNVINTLLYAMMIYRIEGRDTLPVLYYVRSMNQPDYVPLLKDKSTKEEVESYAAYAEQFEAEIASALGELFDFERPFVCCDDDLPCSNCDFVNICGRTAKPEE